MDTPKLTVRPATIDDLPLIREIAFNVWPGTYVPIIGAQQVSYMLDRFYSDDALKQQIQVGQHFFICEDQHKATGFASFTCMDDLHAKLNKLYILPQQQGRGIGSLLLGVVKDKARAAGITTLLVNVNIHNRQAIEFYNRTGFSLLKSEDIAIGNGYYMNDHVLQLPL